MFQFCDISILIIWSSFKPFPRCLWISGRRIMRQILLLTFISLKKIRFSTHWRQRSHF